MQISKNSWHYKVAYFFRCQMGSGDMPRNLCSYVLLMCAEVPCKCVCLLLFSPIFLLIGLGLALCYGIYVVGDWYEKKTGKEITLPEIKEPLFISWIRAKKQKVCPLIEYKE